MRTRVVSDDAFKLTRRMNALGKAARPIFREAGSQVSQIAATDLQGAAKGHSVQTASLASAISARRDRVPYVSVKPQGLYRRRGARKRDAVRAGHIALGSEYGSKRPVFVAPKHGAAPKKWKPGGYWWRPTVKAKQEKWQRVWLDALDRILEKAGG